MSLAELKEKIKDHPISAIVSPYVPLKRSGANLVGVCPFHSDTNPSMSVSDSKGMYKCFSCGAGGDHITFIEHIKNLNFVEALEECSKILGIPFEDYKKQEKRSPNSEMAERLLSKAAQVYKKYAKSETGSPIYQEFLKQRFLDENTAETFSIGLAPKNNILTNYFESIPDPKERSFALKIALQIGLIKQNNQSHYDTFRERIMFPIWDQMGRVVGFSGRALNNETKAKYLNSVESFHFNKRNVLYGLHLAKQEVRGQEGVILVEGYMDMIALYQNGYKNTVAVMGIALSDYSIKRLKSLTENFYLALDSDDAGYKAMKRINAELLKNDVIAKHIDFHPCKDPDDFIQDLGQVELTKRVKEAKYFVDEAINDLIPDTIPEVSTQKLQLLNSAFEILSPLRGKLEARERIIPFAKKINLNSDSKQIENAYEDYLKKNPSQKSEYKIEIKENPKLDVEKNIKVKAQKITKLERILLGVIVSNPDLLSLSKIVDLLDFVDADEVKRLVLRLKELYYEIDTNQYEKFVSNLVAGDDFSLQLKECIGSILYNYQKIELNEKIKKRLLEDLIVKINMESLRQNKQILKDKQKLLTTELELNNLMQEILEIDKKITHLRNKENRPTI